MARKVYITPAEVKAIRLALGVTQAVAAEMVYVSQPAWARWETGENNPSRQSAVLIRRLEKENKGADLTNQKVMV